MKPILAAATVALALTCTPVASADPGINDQICIDARLGMTPGQIGDSLHAAIPNAPPFRLRGAVIPQLGNCDEP